MVLTSELISEFAKATNDTTTAKSESIMYGTIVEKDGSKWVQIDGSDILTPLSSTTNIVSGERVTVMIKNHTAIVTGNISSPAARTAEVELKANSGEPASSVIAGSSVRITQEEVIISTQKFDVNVLSEDGSETMLSIDKDGAYAKSFVAADVTPRYSGADVLYVDPNTTDDQLATGSYFRSLADAFSRLSGRWIDKEVTIHLASTVVEYGSLNLSGISGGCWIRIYGDNSSHAKIVGRLNLYYNASPIEIGYLDIDTTTIGLYSAGHQTVHLYGSVITGPGVDVVGTKAIYSDNGSNIVVSVCELYDCERSLYASLGSNIVGSVNKGNCLVGVDRSIMYLQGSQPCNSSSWTMSEWVGKIYYGSDVVVDQGSGTIPEIEPTTVTLNASVTNSYAPKAGSKWGASGWAGDDGVRQGYSATLGAIRGCMWFNETNISTLKGRTIKQASMRLTRNRVQGASYGVSIKLYGTVLTSDSTNEPVMSKSYGLVVANSDTDTSLGIVWGETETFTIPTEAVADLANGTINALMIVSDDDSLWKDKAYSRNYSHFLGVKESTSDTIPMLTVMYV